jgi:hypothetical protein
LRFHIESRDGKRYHTFGKSADEYRSAIRFEVHIGEKMKSIKLMTAIAAGVLLPFVQSVRADTLAYSANNATGNQTYGGNLGLDFNVVSPILVTGIGAFDDSGDGIAPPITVGIFQRLPGGNPDLDVAGSLISSTVETISGTGNPLVGGYRFITFANPIFLAAGFYTIDAVGFGGSNPNGNENNPTPPFSVSTDSGGGLINFVGTGRFDTVSTLNYPTLSSADQGFPGLTPEPFAGASFTFIAAPLPSSASCGVVLLGILGMMKFRSRKALA